MSIKDIPTFDELKKQFWEDTKTAFGSDIEQSEKGIYFNMSSALLAAINRLNEKLLDIVDADSIYKAEDTDLDNVLVNNFNFVRKQAAKSSGAWSTYDSTAGTVVLAGDLTFRADNNATFTNITGGTVDETGYLELEIECTTTGDIGNVDAETITTLVVSISGIGTGSNEEKVTGGQDYESDSEYRKRFTLSKNQSQWNTEGIVSAILSVSGVTSTKVLQNNTNYVVSIGEGVPVMPAKSRRYYVQGGGAADIALAVYNTTDRAIEETGTVSVDILDIQGDTRKVYFSRPDEVTINYNYDLAGSIDSTTLKTLIEEYIENAGIGAKLSSFKAWEYIKDNADTSNVSDLSIYFKRSTSTSYTVSLQLYDYELGSGVYSA